MIRHSKEFLVQRPLGRVTLHAWCMVRGGRVRWHMAGIVRELRQVVSSSLRF